MRQYQWMLDGVLRDRPDLQDCAVRCCHCGIRFFTHPRNARRQDLRCPFGCREQHRRQQANRRSGKYYRTASGRRKKELRNGKRSWPENAPSHDVLGQATPPEQPNSPSSDTASVNFSAADSTSPSAVEKALELIDSPENAAVPLDGLLLDESTLVNSPILPYVQMIASVIEGRPIGRDELLVLLRKRMRQRSIGRQPRREYVLAYLNQHPP